MATETGHGYAEAQHKAKEKGTFPKLHLPYLNRVGRILEWSDLLQDNIQSHKKKNLLKHMSSGDWVEAVMAKLSTGCEGPSLMIFGDMSGKACSITL